MKDIVQECTASYLQKVDECKRKQAGLQEKIDAANRKIAWHNNRITRFSKRQERIKKPWWPDEIVAPVMAEVARLTPDVTWDTGQLNTHGLRAACSVYGKTENGETVGLTFTFDDGVLSYDTGETTHRFAPGTLGEINGMNNVCIPVESVYTLVAKVNEQSVKLNTQTNEPV